MHKSFPKRLEEQVARLSAYMNLPEPASGDLFFRLVRMPAKGRETVVDINSCGFRYRVRITRFLKSLRRSLLNCESPKPNLNHAVVPSVEISSSYLDAQSPTRLIVADAMELRPNDILYVAEQPIISFNRTLATILPLRILLRDIQDENIP